jgi:hypothetical protein
MCWFMRKFPMHDEDLAPMIRGHEITLQLARTVGLPQLINDIHTDLDLRREMRLDPAKILYGRGITVPENATVAFRELEAQGWELEIRIVEGLYSYINGFNNEKGFYRVQGPQRPPRTATS